MSASTITLQSTLNFASTHGDLLPLSGVGGFSNEPGLTLCNDALSDIISDPQDWVFNRTEMAPVYTCPNKQDYLFAGASAFTLTTSPGGVTTGTSMGWSIDLASNSAITVSGGVVTVNTLEQHRFAIGQTVYLTNVVIKSGNGATAANYNSVFTDDGTISQWTVGWTITAVTLKSFSFAAVSGMSTGDILGAPGITDFHYGTSAALQEVNNNSSPPNQFPFTFKRELAIVSRVANPDKIAVMADLGNGILKLRFSFVPGSTIFAASIVYQAKPPLKVALTDTWSPIPDNYRALINQAVLYRMYRYLNDPKADNEFKKLQQEIAKIQGADDAAQTDVNLQPEESLMDNSYWGWW